MKKVVWFVLALTIAVGLSACGGAGTDVVVDPNASGSQAQVSQSGTEVSGAETVATESSLYYDANGVKIHTYDEAEATLASLGTPTGTFESASCAYQGMDYFYYYDGFQLTVNDVEGVKRVTTITVTDDTVSIPQGVKIGTQEADMVEKMGNNFTQSAGLYKFVDGNTTLQIQVKDGSVASILYVYTLQS